MIPLDRHTHFEPPNNFPVRRLRIDGEFEVKTGLPHYRAAFANAIVDTGSPYVIIPHFVHKPGLKIYPDLGRQPYQLKSINSQQPFAEVGLRFMVQQPVRAFRPPKFVRVKAYLLESGVAPHKVVIGLDAIEQHFILYVPPQPADAYFLETGDAIP